MSQASPFRRLNRRTVLYGAVGLLFPATSFAKSAGAVDLIAQLTNQTRAQAGIGALRGSIRLNKAAHDFSQVLAKTQDLNHRADGRNLSARASAVNYRFTKLGENIGWTSQSRSNRDLASDLIARWMASRGHRRNILNSRFEHLGVGVTQASGRAYAVQIFGAEM